MFQQGRFVCRTQCGEIDSVTNLNLEFHHALEVRVEDDQVSIFSVLQLASASLCVCFALFAVKLFLNAKDAKNAQRYVKDAGSTT